MSGIDTKKMLDSIMQDVRVELLEEYDRNFERKAFFSRRWARAKADPGRGTLMMRTGALRRSVKGRITGRSLIFSSDLPYAVIHNEGGEIVVTRRMKRFFWAMYYKYSGSSVSRRKAALMSDQAGFYKAMALKKIGSRITIPQRQFVGDAPEVEALIRDVIEQNFKEWINSVQKQLKSIEK